MGDSEQEGERLLHALIIYCSASQLWQVEGGWTSSCQG